MHDLYWPGAAHVDGSSTHAMYSSTVARAATMADKAFKSLMGESMMCAKIQRWEFSHKPQREIYRTLAQIGLSFALYYRNRIISGPIVGTTTCNCSLRLVISTAELHRSSCAFEHGGSRVPLSIGYVRFGWRR